MNEILSLKDILENINQYKTPKELQEVIRNCENIKDIIFISYGYPDIRVIVTLDNDKTITETNRKWQRAFYKAIERVIELYKFIIYTKPPFEQTNEYFIIHHSKTKRDCIKICLEEIPHNWDCYIFNMENGKKYDKHGNRI